MAKTTAPMLSFGASGAIAKTMVASKWRGISYMRQHVIPANPQTVAQQLTRTTFAFMREAWKFAGVALTASWDSFAQGRPFTGMNKFVGENIRVLRGQTDLTSIIFSPGAKGGLPPAAIAVTSTVAGEIDIAVTLPTLPVGWAIQSGVGIAIHQQDPSGIFDNDLIEAVVTSATPTAITITGAQTGEDYVVGCWLVETKPDGSLAYSVALTDVVTVA